MYLISSGEEIFCTRKRKRKKGREGSGINKREKGLPVVPKVDGVFFNMFYIWFILLIRLSDTVCETENASAPKSLFLRCVVA